MITPTFNPPREHIGDIIKTNYGEYNTAQFAGLNDRYEAMYTRGAALVQAVTPVYSRAYYWTSANFFTGLDLNLLEYVTPIRDVVSAVQAGLELIRSVLGILQSFLNLGVNVLKMIIDRVLGLLVSILELLNPEGSFHLLVIPPKIGSIGALPKVSIDPAKDSIRVQNAKRAEKTRQDFIRYLANLHTKLPEAIGCQVKEVAEQQYGNLGGSEYLLRVLQTKLNDTGDIARPNLQPYSYSAGVGIFVGSSAINQFIEVWGKVTSLWGSTLDFSKYQLKGLPEAPRLISNRINEANKLACPKKLEQGEFSPTQLAVLVRPQSPRKYLVTGNVQYNFLKRLVYVSNKLDTFDSLPLEKFKDLLSHELTLASAVTSSYIEDSKPLTNIQATPSTFAYPYTSTTISSDSSIITKRTADLEEKLDEGNYYLVAVDFFEIDSGAEGSSYIFRMSNIDRLVIKASTDTRAQDKFISFRGFDSIKYDPKAAYPQWIATPVAVSLLPQAVGTLIEFVNFLKSTLTSLLDDALDWIKLLLDNLAIIITALKDIVTLIDKLIELFQLLASLTGSLGVSVMAFSGSGDSQAMYSMFQEYLDPNFSTSTNIGAQTLEKTTQEEEANRLQQWADSVEANLPDALVRSGASYLDSTGSIDIVNGQRQTIRDFELQKILGGKSPDSTGLSAVADTSYNHSPIFTKEMTTGGIVLLAHSPIEKNLAAVRTLLDLLFSSEENASEGNEQTILENAGLVVDTPPLALEPGFTPDENPAALFTADMKLTDDPSKSPFNFCPSDD